MAKILIIDDKKYLLSALSRPLRRKGHEVVTAENGEEGLERLAGVELIFCDYEMPL